MPRITRRDFVIQAGATAAALSLVPGPNRRARRQGRGLTVKNARLAASWDVVDGHLRPARVDDLLNRTSLPLPAEIFVLVLAEGGVITSSGMTIAGDEAAPDGSHVFHLTDPAGRVRVDWRVRLLPDAGHLHQDITLNAIGAELPIREIVLLDWDVPNSAVIGNVKGSPLVADDWFMAFEHPLADNTVAARRARGSISRELPLRPGAPATYTSVIGTVPHGQRRRGFLAYVERARAHRYRPFLHYNSWYDIGYFSKYNEADALNVINAYGTELHQKRGVTLDSFLFDDGWDDPQTLWHFHSGFPNGFTPLKDAAARYGSAPGVWMSPWGGYGKPREERLAAGAAQGFETNRGGFVLSGPKYYQRFRETCLDMIHTYGVNQFKFDGTGNASRTVPGSQFDSDFDAMIALIGDLRAAKPDLYVNLTTGTYPSPFFLKYADSIWRGGEDHSFAGVGSFRQRWITYKDADTYRGIVGKGPLFPLNSLMLHGMIYARHAKNLDTDPNDDFTSEVHAYFGTGTQLQEMYITPGLLTPANWDAIAEGAAWARRRANVLVDSHWVGGDPALLEPYGHAAWADGAATLVLRNPGDKVQQIELDVADAFELPEGARRDYTMSSPWQTGYGRAPFALTAGKPYVFRLDPFQVLTLETA